MGHSSLIMSNFLKVPPGLVYVSTTYVTLLGGGGLRLNPLAASKSNPTLMRFWSDNKG